MRNVTTRGSVPCAFVTKGKQRIKQFDNNTVYLNNGDEFEIELFNPTTNKVLAEISLDNKSIGAGIVLRPGERVFLERYIETARKFLFETYKVNGNNEEVKVAIASNGSVSVKFYAEYIPAVYKNHTYTFPSIDWNYWGYNNSSNGVVYKTSLDCTFDGQMRDDNANVFFNTTVSPHTPIASVGGASYATYSYDELKPKEIETGRIEKGTASNQTFQYDNTRFNIYWTWISEWKIIPKSQKPIMREDLNALYCGNCGARKGKGSFCQHCGANHWVAK